MDEEYINSTRLVDRELQVFNRRYLRKKRRWFKFMIFVTILISALATLVFIAFMTSNNTGAKIFMGCFLAYFVIIMGFLLRRYRRHYKSFELGQYEVYRAPVTGIHMQITPMHNHISSAGTLSYNDVERLVDTERMNDILFVGSNEAHEGLEIGDIVTVVVTDKNMWGKYKKKDKRTYLAFVIE